MTLTHITPGGGVVRRVFQTAVFWAGLMAAVRLLGFVGVTAYALRRLPSEEMGLWYVMLNIASLATMVEFSFNATIGRFASYYYGGAASVPSLGFASMPTVQAPNLPMLAGLIHMARRLYRLFAVAVTLLMFAAAAGWYVTKRPESATSLHAAAFALLAVGSGVNMAGLCWFGMLYGLNRVVVFNQLMLAGLLLNYSAALAGLASGLGILALVIGQLLLNGVPRLAARRFVRRLIPDSVVANATRISWHDLWPMTWRSGAATLGTYLCIQSTTFLCSFLTELDTTASYGLSMQLALTLHFISAIWMWVKLPVVHSLMMRGDHRSVRGICRQRMPLAIITYILGAVVILTMGPWALRLLGSNTPLLDRGLLAGLLALVGLDLFVGLHSTILKAGNEIPHLRVFLISGVLTVPLALGLGRIWGVGGLLAGSFLVQAAAVYWWTPLQCWKRLRTAS